jgi:hypothetical protein
MKRRALDLILLAVTLVGGVLAWQTGRERSRLRQTYERLSRRTGDLTIADPSRVHLLALDTGQPLHFAWRVYLPPGYKVALRSNAGFSFTSWSGSRDPVQFVARVRLREDEQGNWQVYARFSGSSTRTGLGDQKLAELLRGRWREVRVTQLGSPDMVAVEPGRPATLLRLTLPEDLQAEAREKLPADDLRRYVPVLFDLELGPATSKP